MNEYYLSSTELISIRVALTIDGSSLITRHFAGSRGKDLLKLNNAIHRLKIVLYYSLPLNICECLLCQIY